MTELKRVLLVEDSENDAELALAAFAETNLANEVVVVKDGQEALADLSERIAEALAPVLLVTYLLARSGEHLRDLGLDAAQPGRDTARGAVLAALIGGTGLLLYLGAYHLGVSLNVVPESLPAVWWRTPVLLLSALHDGLLEEVVVLAYLLRRLDQLGWTPWKAIALSAVLRGSYHLYQGFGAFAGNAVMGLIFGYLYKRWGRCAPMVVAHFLIDAVTFIGYAALHGKVSWLP